MSDTRQSPAFVFGADLPVGVAAHLAVVPTARVYIFRRDAVNETVVSAQPSTNIAVGISGRVVW